jgi:hypothetical protein
MQVPAVARARAGFARRARKVTVTVALGGDAVPAAAELRTALDSIPTSVPVSWHLLPGSAVTPHIRVDIALAGTPIATAAALDRWPDAAVVALMYGPDHDVTAAVRALDAGADVCVHDASTDLIAAYVASVARRRGLLAC